MVHTRNSRADKAETGTPWGSRVIFNSEPQVPVRDPDSETNKQTANSTGNERKLLEPMASVYTRSRAAGLGTFNEHIRPRFRCAKELLSCEKGLLFLSQSCRKQHFRGLVSQEL